MVNIKTSVEAVIFQSLGFIKNTILVGVGRYNLTSRYD